MSNEIDGPNRPSAPIKESKFPSAKRLSRPKGRPRKIRAGSPSVFKIPDPDQVYDYARLGMTLKQVSDALSCSYSYLFEVLRSYPVLEESYRRGRADGVQKNLRKLDEHIEAGKAGPLYFWLERIAGFAARADLTMHEPDRPPISLTLEQQKAMAMAVLDIAEIAHEPRAIQRVENVLESGAIEVEAERVESSTEIEAGVKEGSMLMRHRVKSATMRGDE